jgi:hypothetical protein
MLKQEHNFKYRVHRPLKKAASCPWHGFNQYFSSVFEPAIIRTGGFSTAG